MSISGLGGSTPISSMNSLLSAAAPTTPTAPGAGLQSDAVQPTSSSGSNSIIQIEEKMLMEILQMMLQLLQQQLQSNTSGSGAGLSNGGNNVGSSSPSGGGNNVGSSSPSGGGNNVGSSGSSGSGNSSGGPAPQNLQQIDQKYGAQIDNALAANGNPQGLTKKYVEAEIMQESGGNANAVGDGGSSLGLLQINNADAANTSGKFAGGNRLDSQTNLNMAVEDMAGYAAQGYSLGGVANAYEDGGNPAGIGDGYGASVLSIMNGGGGN